MSPTPVILDVDPGHDDAVALMLACGAPELEVREELKSLAVPSQTCSPEVQELYTKIWTELQK